MEPLLADPIPVVPEASEGPGALGRRRIARTRHEASALAGFARKRVFQRVLGPPDAHRATVTDETQLLLPFHRFELAPFPLRFGGAPAERAVVWIPGREEMPMAETSFFGANTLAALDVPIGETTLEAQGGEGSEPLFPIVPMDVTADLARRRALRVASSSSSRSKSTDREDPLASDTRIAMHDVILLPACVLRYRYRGEVFPEGGAFSVGISACTGKALWELHPPLVRSALGKFRKTLSFG